MADLEDPIVMDCPGAGGKGNLSDHWSANCQYCNERLPFDCGRIPPHQTNGEAHENEKDLRHEGRRRLMPNQPAPGYTAAYQRARRAADTYIRQKYYPEWRAKFNEERNKQENET